MKEKARVIAYVHLILGSIGSLLAAFLGGRTAYEYSYSGVRYDRNWLVTIVIFAGAMIAVITLYVILMGLYEVLQNQEWIANQFEELSSSRVSKEDNGPSQKASNSKADLLSAARKITGSTGSTWVCPECGETNPISIRICKGCGRDK